MPCNVALIGFGEAGEALARAFGLVPSARAFDIAEDRRAAMREFGFEACSSAQDAMAGAPFILSLITADQALAAAQDYAGFIAPGAIWCDCNSVAPATKREAARAIEAAGGRYVDAAIMAPVSPPRRDLPMLLSGHAALDAREALAGLGLTKVRVVGDEIGKASAIKMIRSVMVKGIEALTDEMMAAADAAGVTDEVIASLDASEKAVPWREKAAYNLERMAAHGLRRAAEMEEAAKTLTSLGVEAIMTQGTVRRQREQGLRGKGNKS